MAAPQAAARGVLGSAVRAAQQAETQHQTAKEFFKEVRDASRAAADALSSQPQLCRSAN